MWQRLLHQASLPPLSGNDMSDFQVLVMTTGFIAGTLAFLINIIAVIVAVYKMGRAVERFESIGKQQSQEISELKTAVSQMAQLITDNTLLSHRQDTVEHRLNLMDKLVDDIRRGEGMILPLPSSPYRFPPNASGSAGEQR